jgi:serine/threonine protein kinase/Tol biopolymer transport system component
MPLAAGTKLGVYEVIEPIGAGGMGEVYKARDARLERHVAIKILPLHVASDPTLRQRFEREAKLLASLSHPHICGVFDVGHAPTDHGDIDFLVMEYLDGETLAKRLQRGSLSLSEALRYAIQLADALDQAHRKGVIHRDLKPGNIMLTAIGAKVLDFGLARVTVSAADPAAAPTVTSPLTGAGALVGTFQYMAPEQLEGREADARTDIFAYGAVLYEMLTGRRAFEGKSHANVIGAILERDPQSLSATLATVPAALDQVVRTCLRKNPEQRWQSAGDIGRQLSWILEDSSQSGSRAAPPASATRKPAWLVPTVAGAVVVAAAALVGWALIRSPETPTREVSRLTLTPASNAPLVSVGGVDVVITPDGRRIVYLGGRPEGGRVLYIRDLSSLESRPIAGTELPENFPVANPFITGDGESVVFRSPGKGILSVPLRGGPPLKLADDSPRFLSGASAADDTVVFALGDGLYRTSTKGGGTLERLTPPRDQVLYFAPSELPGGQAILYHTRNVREQANRVFALDLRTREEHPLADDGIAPRYAPTGHLVFARGTTLMAVAFDAARLAVTGTPVTVQEGVQHPSGIAAPDYSLSTNGTLVYVPVAPATAAAAAVWVDRSGRELGAFLPTPMTNITPAPRISPDGKRVVISHGAGGAGGDSDLWVYDLTGRPPLRLAEKGFNGAGIWSPDGTRIVFISNRDGGFDIYSVPADGSALEPSRVDLGGDRPIEGVPTSFPQSWLPDGRLVFVDNAGVAGNANLLAAAAKPGGKPEPLVQTQYSENFARVSPDGRWLAYASDRSGRFEIWVQPLAGGAPSRVSLNGGNRPVWSRDNRELFYLEGPKMMGVRIKASGTEFGFEPATQLYDRPYRLDYDVAPDGRFLMLPLANQPGGSASQNIVVVQNWTEELKRLVPN